MAYAYREGSAPKPAITKRVPDAYPSRWLVCLVGLALLSVSLIVTWSMHSSAVICHDTACVVRQEYPFQSTQDFAFDARKPPTVVVTRATVGKNNEGRRLALLYADGSSVELARELGDGPDADAARLRAYFANPRGALVTQPGSCALDVSFGCLFASMGALTLLFGLGLFLWRRVGSDSARHVIMVDNGRARHLPQAV